MLGSTVNTCSASVLEFLDEFCTFSTMKESDVNLFNVLQLAGGSKVEIDIDKVVQPLRAPFERLRADFAPVDGWRD